MAHVLIIEDDQTIRETLAYNLKAAGFTISTAADGISGLEQAIAEKPDAVLLDLLLPKLDGLAVCEKLRRQNHSARIIMITALGTDSDKIRGLTVGADDYITKPFNFEELLARLRAQLRHAPGKAEHSIITFGDVKIDPQKHELRVKRATVEIKPKEFLLLLTLAANPKTLFSRQQLSDLIWGASYMRSSRTIDVHINRLRSHVEKLSDFNFIKTVHGLGYRFELNKKSERARENK